MKFKLLLLLLLPVLMAKSQAFMISGLVKNEAMEPVPVWPVTIQSVAGIWPYFNEVVFTDVNGHYQFTGVAGDSTVLQMTVSTPDCNQMPVDTSFLIWGGQGIVANLVICTPNIPEPCVASYNYFPSGDTLAGHTFQFINTSTGPFYQVLWDFGDGITSTEVAPVHTFAAGVWNVCLIISDPIPVNNCSDAHCEPIQVDSAWPCANDFLFQVNGLGAGFSGWTNNLLEAAYYWNFGDGEEASGQTVSHEYPGAGDYVVTLSTVDEAGCSAVSSRTVFIAGLPCEAQFSWVTDPGNPHLVHFADQSVGDIQFWSWNFGDGALSADSSPTHLFQAGEWNVCLTISSASGLCYDVYCQTVVIQDSAVCEALFNWTIDPVNPLVVHFNNQSTGESDQWTWSFGDGTASYELNPDHTFAQNGTYGVCLTVWSFDSTCFSTTCHSIVVGESVYFPVIGQVLADFFPADEVGVKLYESVGGIPVFSDSAWVAQYGSFAFYAVPQGNYILKAELEPASSLYAAFLPTYSGNTVLWEEAVTLYVNQPVSGADIWLVPVPALTSGSAVISGIVQWAGGTKTGYGTGMAGVPIFLFSSQNELIQAVYSDSEGQFVFRDVPDGSYQVRPEITGLPVTPFPVLVGGTSVVVSGVTFNVSEIGIQYGVDEPMPAGVVSVGFPVPNPSRENASIEIQAGQAMILSVAVVDFSGRVVLSLDESLEPGVNRLSLSVDDLQPGIYSLLLNKGGGAVVVRKMVVL